MIYICKSCTPLPAGLEDEEDLISSYVQWIDHLHSSVHQFVTNNCFQNWSRSQDEKSWVIIVNDKSQRITGQDERSQIVSYFGNYGILSDICFHPSRKFCVLTLDGDPYRRNNPALGINELHTVGESFVVKIRRKLDISRAEWKILESDRITVNDSTIEVPTATPALTWANVVQKDISSQILTVKTPDLEKSRPKKPRHRNHRNQNVVVTLPRFHGIPSSSSKLNNTNGSEEELPVKLVPLEFINSKFKSQLTENKTTSKNKNSTTSSNPMTSKVNSNKHVELHENFQKRANSACNGGSSEVNRGQSGSQQRGNERNSQTDRTRNNNNLSSRLSREYQIPPEPSDFTVLFRELPRLVGCQRSNNPIIKEFERLDVDRQFLYFMYSTTMTDIELNKRSRLLQELTNVIKEEFPKCILFPFGSLQTGLGDSESDIDIYVDAFGDTSGMNVIPNDGHRPTKQEIMMKIKTLLKRSKYVNTRKSMYGMVIPVLSARVPILKFCHFQTRINCDLSFENLLSCQNTKMISFFMTLDPRVRPLLLLVRYWGRFHQLTGSSLIKNYALILLALVFLARRGIVPTILSLQSVVPPFVIEGWNAAFSEDSGRMKATIKDSPLYETNTINGQPTTFSILSLAQEFFYTMAHFDFKTKMICSLLGDSLEKELFTPGNEEGLPEPLERYKSWSAGQNIKTRLNIDTPLCIQDPFLLSFNVGAVTTENTLLKFQVACAQTSLSLKRITGLLCTFNSLPKEIGDKKFMKMQREQKKQEQMKLEIKTILHYDLEDIAENENKVIIPTHLLPLEQIIDKRTIQYGNGWESYSRFFASKMVKPFNRLCSRDLKSLTTEQMIPAVMDEKLKVLWLSFVQDFLTDVWPTCFDINVVCKHDSKKSERFSTSRNGRRRREDENHSPCQNDEDDDGESEEEDSVSGSAEEKTEKERELLNEKLMALPPMEGIIYYYIFECTAKKPFWPKRDRIRQEILREYYPKKVYEEVNNSNSNTKCTEAEQKAQSKSKASKVGKGKGKESKQGGGSIISGKSENKRKKGYCPKGIDPFMIEKQVTQQVQTLGVKDKENSVDQEKPVFKLNCLIKLDASCVDELPELFIIFEKVDGYHQNYASGGSAIAGTFKHLVTDYLSHRIHNWFGGSSSNGECVGGSCSGGKTTGLPDITFSSSSSSVSSCRTSPVPVPAPASIDFDLED